MKREFQFGFLRAAGLQPEHILIDVGCGTLRGGIPLIRYLDAGCYYGVDIRQDVLDEGKHELKESGLDHKTPILCAESLDNIRFETKADYIWAFSVLFHMADSDVDKCIGFVDRHLASTGRFYANVNIGERASGCWQGFPVNFRNLEFYAASAQKYNLRVKDLGELREYGHCTGTSQDNQRMLLFERV